MELLAAKRTCDWMTGTGMARHMDGIEALVRPTVLQDATAFCTAGALESMLPDMNVRKVQEVAADIPYGTLTENLEACSSNLCRAAATFCKLPPNILGYLAKCCIHQIHRIIEASEAKTIGDVHAAHVACSQVVNQNRMQQCLKQQLNSDLRNGGFIIGEPPEELLQRNRRMLGRTLLRKREFISKDDLDTWDILDADSELARRMTIFLSVWNGD